VATLPAIIRRVINLGSALYCVRPLCPRPCVSSVSHARAATVLVICVFYPLQPEKRPRLMIEVPPTAFRIETLTLTFTPDLQFHESYGHDPYACKRSRSKALDSSGNRWTYGRTEAIELPPVLTRSVNSAWLSFCVVQNFQFLILYFVVIKNRGEEK